MCECRHDPPPPTHRRPIRRSGGHRALVRAKATALALGAMGISLLFGVANFLMTHQNTAAIEAQESGK